MKTLNSINIKITEELLNNIAAVLIKGNIKSPEVNKDNIPEIVEYLSKSHIGKFFDVRLLHDIVNDNIDELSSKCDINGLYKSMKEDRSLIEMIDEIEDDGSPLWTQEEIINCQITFQRILSIAEHNINKGELVAILKINEILKKLPVLFKRKSDKSLDLSKEDLYKNETNENRKIVLLANSTYKSKSELESINNRFKNAGDLVVVGKKHIRPSNKGLLEMYKNIQYLIVDTSNMKKANRSYGYDPLGGNINQFKNEMNHLKYSENREPIKVYEYDSRDSHEKIKRLE